MDNFDLRKYLAEGKLFEEELTPLQKYIFDYESDISDEVDMRAIKGLENANDVYDYYADVRGWEGDPDFEDDLDNIYRQVKVKFGEGKLNENQDDSYYIDVTFQPIRHWATVLRKQVVLWRLHRPNRKNFSDRHQSNIPRK